VKEKRKNKRHLDRSWMPVMPMLVSEEKYNRYRDKIIMLSLNIQVMKNSYQSEMERKLCMGLSGKEIAKILDLEEWEVTKIRTVAESEIVEQVWDRISQDNFDFQGIAPGAEEAKEYYRQLIAEGVENKLGLIARG
jgi:hypothetical protein